MSHDENEGSGFGPVIWVVLACILGALFLIALVIPKDVTQFFLKVNESFNSIFESETFISLRFVAGIITVGLSGLATWLFFKLLEMEKEHEEHVYHHAHGHEGDGEEHHDHASATHTPEAPIHTVPLASEDSHNPVSDGAQVKTAPPPSHMYKEGLPGESGVRGTQIGEEHPGRFQWQSVLRLATSQNPSDWKLAIIEADVILDMMTYIQGFQGDTLGERLKNADPGFFKNLDFAKKAHYMRNQIAHNPDVSLTPRDVNQTIRMYEAVFNEFKYI